MAAKRERDAAAEQQPDAEEQPAAKARCTGAHCEDKRHIQWAAKLVVQVDPPHSMPQAAEAQAWAQTATPNATTAPQAASDLPKAAAEVPAEPEARAAKANADYWTRFGHRQKNSVKYAESHLAYWWCVVQREKMQLQAHLDGNRRTEELQLEEIKNKHGVVIAHVDPDPDIDRLHIKVWSPDSDKYICFLDCKYEDTIANLKRKIQQHPDVIHHMAFRDMQLFYNGCQLLDCDTLEWCDIDDDCILHCVDHDNAVSMAAIAGNWVARSSQRLHQWRLLRAHVLQPPPVDKIAEKDLSPVPISAVVSGARQFFDPTNHQMRVGL